MRHHIQCAVLDILSRSESLRYSEIKPIDLDGNVFGYHLKLLVQDNLIEKRTDGAYQLTATGKDYIVHRYEDPLLRAHSILLIVIRRGDSWLMRRRLIQPHLGLTGFVHGEPRSNETIITSSQRRLVEKTGLSTPLHLHCGGIITLKNPHSDIAESYSHTIVLTGTTENDFTIESDTTGEQSWHTTDEIIASPDKFLPSCLDLITRIQANDTSFFRAVLHDRSIDNNRVFHPHHT